MKIEMTPVLEEIRDILDVATDEEVSNTLDLIIKEGRRRGFPDYWWE